MELTTILRFHALEGREEELVAALRDQDVAVRAEAGCRAFAAYRSTRDPRLCWIHSRWADEAAFELHAELPNTKAFLARVLPLIGHPLDLWRTLRITSQEPV